MAGTTVTPAFRYVAQTGSPLVRTWCCQDFAQLQSACRMDRVRAGSGAKRSLLTRTKLYSRVGTGGATSGTAYVHYWKMLRGSWLFPEA